MSKSKEFNDRGDTGGHSGGRQGSELVSIEEAREFAKSRPKLLVNSGGNITTIQHLPGFGEDWDDGLCCNVNPDRLLAKDHACYPEGYLKICETCRATLWRERYGGDDE